MLKIPTRHRAGLGALTSYVNLACKANKHALPGEEVPGVFPSRGVAEGERGGREAVQPRERNLTGSTGPRAGASGRTIPGSRNLGYTILCGGVRILEIRGGGRAGLRKGDVICRFDGKLVGDANKALGWIQKKLPGTKVPVMCYRNDEFWKMDVTVGK